MSNAPETEQTTPERPKAQLADDILLILPVRNLVLFPGAVTQISLGRDVSIAAAKEAVANDRKLGILLQREPSVDRPGADDLFTIGTVASVVRFITARSGMHHLICQGEQRFRALDFVPGLPFLAARFDLITEPESSSAEIEALTQHLKNQASEAIDLLPQAPPELAAALESIDSPGMLADLIASVIDIKPNQKQAILETIGVRSRLERLSDLMSHRLKVLRLSREIDEQTQEKLNERQREYLLREQLKTIQKELGDDTANTELAELERAIQDAGMPADVKAHAEKELKRLRGMPDASAEYSMVRSYLDLLIELPWSRLDEESIDITAARRILDEDHYGLPKVKRRILEYLAVRKLNPEGRSPILCFVGPPGVGKTSLLRRKRGL